MSHTLSIAELPTHVHQMTASAHQAAGGTPGPTVILAQSSGAALYANASNLVGMHAASIANAGASQAHENMQPYLTLTYCIALQGIFPTPELGGEPMAQPYVGEIRIFAGSFAPAGWAFCDGQLPADLRERDAVPAHRHDLRRRRPGDLRAAGPAGPRCRSTRAPGSTYQPQTGGVEAVTLTVNQIPAHTHPLAGDAQPGKRDRPGQPGARAHARRRRSRPTAPTTRPSSLHAVGRQRRSAAASRTTNMQPYLCVDFIISLFGIFPSPDLGAAHVRPVRRRDPHLRLQFAPTGWAQCNGQLMPITQNTALFSLLGTFYGGNGKSTFALPEPPGIGSDAPRAGAGAGRPLPGRAGGTETVTLLESEIPAHTHAVTGSGSDANSQTPNGPKLASGIGIGRFGQPDPPDAAPT